jgi:hypothetical protein
MRIVLTRVFMLALCAAALLAGWCFHAGVWCLPPRWDPWAPLDLDEAPGLLTPWKLARTLADPALCRTALAGSALSYQAAAERIDPGGCDVHNAVRVAAHARGGVAAAGFNQGFLATCPLALAMAWFEHRDLQADARAWYGEPVVRITHVGSYACRNIDHAASGALSEHAHANALDVTGFVLADGRYVTVARDWHGAARDAGFLHQVHDDACSVFHVVLGPGYDAAHSTHFHLDMGPYRACR